MLSAAFLVLFGAALCIAVPLDECPTYFHQENEEFDQQKWDAMAVCAKGLHGKELADYLKSHQDFYKVSIRFYFLRPASTLCPTEIRSVGHGGRSETQAPAWCRIIEIVSLS